MKKVVNAFRQLKNSLLQGQKEDKNVSAYHVMSGSAAGLTRGVGERSIESTTSFMRRRHFENR